MGYAWQGNQVIRRVKSRFINMMISENAIPAGLASYDTLKLKPKKYAYDRILTPQLVWADKVEYISYYGDKTRKGTFKGGRKTNPKKMRVKLKAMNQWLKSIQNAIEFKERWPILKQELIGYYRYLE